MPVGKSYLRYNSCQTLGDCHHALSLHLNPVGAYGDDLNMNGMGQGPYMYYRHSDSITHQSGLTLPSTSMAPKTTPTTEEIDELTAKFETIGLNQAKAKDAAKSAKIAEPLKRLVETFKLSERSVNDKQASLLVHFAPPSSKLAGDRERGYIIDKIVDGKLKSTDQVNGESDISVAWDPPLI